MVDSRMDLCFNSFTMPHVEKDFPLAASIAVGCMDFGELGASSMPIPEDCNVIYIYIYLSIYLYIYIYICIHCIFFCNM